MSTRWFRIGEALAAAACLALLAGCARGAGEVIANVEPPTVSPYFGPAATLSPTVATAAPAGTPTIALFFRVETVTSRPTNTRQTVPTPRPTVTTAPGEVAEEVAEAAEEAVEKVAEATEEVPEEALAEALGKTPTSVITGYAETPIYDDALASGWSTQYSNGVAFGLADTRYIHSGTTGAVVTPLQDYATLFFTVMQDAPASYPRERVIGVRFWLNGGADEIAPEDLAVTVIGSDALTYYAPDDESVTLGEPDVFSETRLYDLDVNRLIPADTWVEIVVNLDDLVFDPDYTYVTGVYLKNDEGFTQTFYVDDIALILLEEEK